MNCSELCFYQCLKTCLIQDQNCKQCPMYGKYDDHLCKTLLLDEIRQRTITEIRKQDFLDDKKMSREKCEMLIGEKLEEIRSIVKEYDPNINLVSMYISERTSSAWALSDDDEDSEYLLKVDVEQEVEDDDC